MIQAFAASSWLQLVNLAAAMDAGLLEDADERILIACDTRTVSEVGPSFWELPEAAPLLERFTRVVDFNAWIWPMHPAQWAPGTLDQPMLTKLYRRAWGIDGPHLQLFLESIQSRPGTALAALFPDAELFVHSDGLMGYGPTRNRLSPVIWHRLRGFLYMDLVPDLRPLMFSEFPDVQLQPVPVDALRAVVREVLREVAEPLPVVDVPEGRVGLVIGQYLSDIGLIDLEEEIGVYEALVRRAIADGCTTICFKAHPAASSAVTSVLAERTQRAGITFRKVESSLPLELYLEQLRPDAVYSCFSTGMVTAWRMHGIPAHTAGTTLALERFTPYENSNRIPVTICRHLFDDEANGGYSLSDLVEAVGYCMQPVNCGHLRPAARSFLSAHFAEARVYFKRRRLSKLDLPGRLPAPAPTVGRRVRNAALRSLPAPVLDRVRPRVITARNTVIDRAQPLGDRALSLIDRARGLTDRRGPADQSSPAGHRGLTHQSSPTVRRSLTDRQGRP